MRKVLTENQLRRLVRVLVKEIAEMDPETKILKIQSLVRGGQHQNSSLGDQFAEIDRLRAVMRDVFHNLSSEEIDNLISRNFK